MATSMLRLGRNGCFKCLQLESLGVLRSGSAAALCTQAEETAKSTKNTKAASKTAETPEERATLLTYKTAVAFPVRFSQPGFFPAQSIGVAVPVASSTATTEAETAAVATLPVTVVSDPYLDMTQAEETPSGSSHPAPSPDVAQVVDDTPPSVVDTTAESLVYAASTTLSPFDNPTAAAPLDDAVPNTTASSDLGDPATDISSSLLDSSDSDSDSDTDTDTDSDTDTDTDTSYGDEKSEVRTETKTSPPLVAESMKEDEEVQVNMVTSKMKEGTHEDKKEILPETVDYPAPAVDADQDTAPTVLASIEAAQATMETSTFYSDELVDSASDICTAAEDTLEGTVLAAAALNPAPQVIKDIASPAVPCAHVEAPVIVMAEVANTEKNPSDAPVDTTDCASAEALGDAAEEATTEPLEAEAAPAVVAAETPAEVSAPVESPKELMDPAPIIVEAEEADLQAEATVEPSDETVVAAPPEPEEPFDNSTYKNYQHHCYTPYTFADLDVEMAKFRLPQPSSGRPSPRH